MNQKVVICSCRFIVIAWLYITFILLAGCGGSSGGDSSNTRDNMLSISAPSEYPTGIGATAYITIQNNSAESLTNLEYTIPTDTNYTGVDVTINDSLCNSLAPMESCVLSVNIPSGSNSGSFAVKVSLLNSNNIVQNNLNESFLINIGLSKLLENNHSGANGISFLYQNTLAVSSAGDTYIMVVGVINSMLAGTFNTLNLTDSAGAVLDFSVLSGNSGLGADELTQGSVVTLLLKIPSGSVGSYSFYAQTMQDGVVIDTATESNVINLINNNSGFLVAKPTNFSLSLMDGYSEQTIVFTNMGHQSVDDLEFDIANVTNDLVTIISDNCTQNNITPYINNSCSIVVGLSSNADSIGGGELIASYTGGSVSSKFDYRGAYTVSAIMSNESSGNQSISEVTTNESFYIVLKLNSQMDVAESTFEVEVPNGFTVNSNSCTLSSESPSCWVMVTAPNESSANNEITITGHPTPTPATFTFDVVLPTYYIFVTGAHDGNFGGLVGANAWCESSPNKPTGSTATYQASLYGNTPFTASRQYTFWYENAAHNTWTASGSDYTQMNDQVFGAVIYTSIPTGIGIDDAGVWYGTASLNCGSWTSNASSQSASDTGTFMWTGANPGETGVAPKACSNGNNLTSNTSFGVVCVAQDAE